jgi:hypothetical protein
MNNDVPLDRLQRWMLSVITHPQGVAAGVADPAAQGEIRVTAEDLEQIVTRSRACDSLERLAVYSGAYFARLLECLEAEFEAVTRAAGREAFTSLAAGYLQAHPPSSYTLNRLGARFPRYLEESRPPRADGAEQPDWADLLIDLALLERCESEVFDGPGEEGSPPIDSAMLSTVPAHQWSALRVRTSASLRILRLRFPVHEYQASLRRSADAALPRPRPVTLAISRRNYALGRRELTAPQETLLKSLVDLPLGGALETTLAADALSPEELLAVLPEWFRDWTAAAIIAGIDLPRLTH